MSASRRNTDVKKIKQKNSLGCVPPPAIIEPAPGATEYVFIHRTVQKNGTVTLKRLKQGARVNIAQVGDQTFVVSALPQADVAKLLTHLPASRPSAYDALSDRLRGQPHTISEQRIRHEYKPELTVQALDDETALRLADVSRARRVR